jgi:hypothetical protein
MAMMRSPWSRRWQPVAVAMFTLGLAALVGLATVRLQLTTSPLLIALLGAALAMACMWIVIRKLDNRAGIAATSEGMLASLAFLLLPLNAIRVSTNATAGDLLLLALSVFFVARLVTGRVNEVPSWLILGVTLVSVSVVAQELQGLDLGADVIPGVMFIVAMAGTPLLLFGAARRPGYREVLVLAWLLGSALASAAALLDASGLTSIGPTLTGVVWDGRYAGLTVHPNHLGLVAVMAFPVAVWWLNSRPGRSAQVLGAGLAGLLILGVLASGSRAAMISLVVVGALSLLAQARNRNDRAISPLVLLCGCGLVVGAVYLMMPTTAGNGFARLLGQSDLAVDNQDRLGAMTASLFGYYGSPLIGTGFSSVKAANNLVLQTLQAGGMLTALGLAVFLSGAIARGLRTSLVSDGLGTALSLSLLAWLVDGMFQNIIYDRFLFLPVALVLALRSAGTSRSK